MRKAFQTLEDRDIHNVESNGPFICNNKHAWLGNGYYFWDSFIDNAHWWGKEVTKYRNGYIICEANYLLDEKRCFNLVDNPEHLTQFNQTKNILISEGLYKQNVTTVARVIKFIKEKIGIFNYEAIRAYGVNSINPVSTFSKRTIFQYREDKMSFQYLDSVPAIQICFFTKKSLDLNRFRIIFPVEYIDDYLV